MFDKEARVDWANDDDHLPPPQPRRTRSKTKEKSKYFGSKLPLKMSKGFFN